MISRMSLGLMTGVVALTIGAGLAFAALSGDDAIKARQACMKANGAMMGVMVPMIKGEKPYDAAAVQAVSEPPSAA